MTPPGQESEEAEAYDARPTLTVSAVARRLGVAPATLRTWARRYDLGPSEHTAGAHRRYSAADLARLVVMRRLTLQGVAPADAARVARDARLQDDGVSVLAVAASGAASAAGAGAGAGDLAEPGRGGGGRVVAMPDAEPAQRGLARAAMSLDGTGCTRILVDAIRRSGVQEAYASLVLPVLTALGRRWALTGAGVDVEHLLSESVLAALRATAHPVPGRGAPALLACAEDEQHSLPVHVLAAALGEQEVATRVLGARVPASALAAAVRRCGPAVVFLYAAMPVLDAAQLEQLPRLRPAPRLVVGGPGWDDVELPDGPAGRVLRVGSLAEAVREVTLAAG